MSPSSEIAGIRQELTELNETTEQFAKFVTVCGDLLQKQAEKLKGLELEIEAMKFSRAIDEAERG